MTRNSTDDKFLVFGQTYLYWLENEVFPYLFGSICSLELIVGVAVNIFITLLYIKHRQNESCITNINFIISDFVAHIFILLPAVVMSLSTADSLPSALCSVLGVLNNMVFVFQFGIFNFVLICISLSLRNKAMHLFPGSLIIMIISVIIALVSLLLALLPMATDTSYQLQKQEHRCGIEKSSLKYLTNMSLVPFFGSVISAFVALWFITKSVLKSDGESDPNSESEQQTDLTEQTDESDNGPGVKETKLITVAETKEMNNIQTKSSSWCDNEVVNDNDRTDSRQSVAITINNEIPAHAWSHQESFSGTSPSTEIDSTDMSPTPLGTAAYPSPNDVDSNGIAHKYTVVADIFRGKTPCKLTIRNAVTYIVMWLIMCVCWSPYVVFTYITMYSSLWWDGWLTVAVCVGYISYCTKPIVLLIMRKDLRQKSAELLPQSFSKNAKKIELKLKSVL